MQRDKFCLRVVPDSVPLRVGFQNDHLVLTWDGSPILGWHHGYVEVTYPNESDPSRLYYVVHVEDTLSTETVSGDLTGHLHSDSDKLFKRLAKAASSANAALPRDDLLKSLVEHIRHQERLMHSVECELEVSITATDPHMIPILKRARARVGDEEYKRFILQDASAMSMGYKEHWYCHGIKQRSEKNHGLRSPGVQVIT